MHLRVQFVLSTCYHDLLRLLVVRVVCVTSPLYASFALRSESNDAAEVSDASDV